MASSVPLNPQRARAQPNMCESRAEMAAIAAIADDIGQRNRTHLNPPPCRTKGCSRSLAGISSTEEIQLAPRDFQDARVTFASCTRRIDLEPHPSLMADSWLSTVDAPASGLRAAPLEDRTYTLMTPRTR